MLPVTVKNQQEPPDNIEEPRKKRKISFKIKNSTGPRRYNSNTTTTLSANKVQQLTNKFNKLIKDEPKVAKLVRRTNSTKPEQNRKPSIRPKPSFRTKKHKPDLEKHPETARHSVRETIEIFERRKSESLENQILNKPKIPEKTVNKTKELVIQDGVKKLKILPLTASTAPKIPANKLYDTLKITKTTSSHHLLKMVTEETPDKKVPNNSFLWRSRSSTFNIYACIDYEDTNKPIYKDTGQEMEDLYDTVGPQIINEEQQKYEKLLALTDEILNEYKSKQLSDNSSIHSYESFYNNYEAIEQSSEATEAIYETLSTKEDNENDKQEKEDIYTTVKEDDDSDQQSNSLYYALRTHSSHSSSNSYSPSSSEKSNASEDCWIDVSDPEEENQGFIIVRDKHKSRKNGWANKVRDQWSKAPKKIVVLEENESYHLYESLNSEEDFDSFDSSSDDESSFTKINPNDSGVEMGLSQLPELPRNETMSGGNIYGLTRLAARLRKNWSLTKNDITKSLSRMTKKRDRVPPPRPPPPIFPVTSSPTEPSDENGRKKNWLKFRRAVSMGETSVEDSNSTFYVPEQDTIEKPQVPVRKRASRPLSPPPPAPVPKSDKENKENKEKQRTTSWYAECGLFKGDLPVSEVTTLTPTTTRSSSTCWYAEVGLYQPKTCTDSSGSVENSGNSIKPDLIPNTKSNSKFYTHQEDLDTYYNIKNQNYYNASLKKVEKMATLLRDEPLYQFYDAAVAENAFHETSSDSEYDGYEEIGELLEKPTNNDSNGSKCDSNDSKCERTSVRNRIPNCRTLWCEIPEVIQSEILRTLTSNQKKLQEAKFEILTSEASYLNSLNILTEHFVAKLTQNDLLTEPDQKILFGNIYDVKKCSENLLTDLETCWEESILIPNIANIIQKYCNEHFKVYIDYCANQTLSDAILRKSRGDTSSKSPKPTNFAQVLTRIESNTICQGLNLHSFLMLPMQRVTRYPLLLDAVLRRLTPSDDDFHACQIALGSLHDLARRCNEAARLTERISELQKIQTQLEFAPGISEVRLLEEGAKRYLVKSGELVQLLAKGGAKSDEPGIKLTFGKRFHKQLVTVMLFEDLIIIARKKSDDSLLVLHHCPRSFLELSPPDQQPPTIDSSLLIFLTLLENQDGKQISLLLSCSSETERTRWIEALTPKLTEDPNETIYESWDCPQVQAIHLYEAIQPDELNLKRGDVVNVDKKMKDGWFHGENLQNGLCGWFPGNHTIEIANPHVRARNLRQRYRLLAYTDEFLNNKI